MFVISSGGVLAEDWSTRDGKWWLNRTVLEKAIYTAGMLDGVNAGEAIVLRDGLASADSFNADVKRLFGKVDGRQMRDGIDTFYRDFRNRSIPTYVAMWIVALQINGADQSQIEKMLRQFRRGN